MIERGVYMACIIKKYIPKETLEGAGVLVNRVFGYYQVPDFDPFLMLDYFVTESADQSPGFPWHPHKGIETITYMLRGKIEHKDSIGNGGIIGAGDVQWMTAAGGIYHQEMPQPEPGGYQGFQFWLNMPAAHKYDSSKYHGLTAEDMTHVQKDGAEVIIIGGSYDGSAGPMNDTERDVRLMHVKIDAGKSIIIERKGGKAGFVFVFAGDGSANDEALESVAAFRLAEGEITFSAGKEGMEFMFAEGVPCEESISWYGPMVMNTDQEIQSALKDLRDGTFAGHPNAR